MKSKDYEGKLSSPVLRGLGRSNPTRLPDRLMPMLIPSGFAERELDVAKSSELKTSNSRLPCLECKACRPVAAIETACKKNLVIILRVEDFDRPLFIKRL